MPLIESLPDTRTLLLWASVFSVGALLVAVLAVPWVVARLPAGYFNRAHRNPWHTLAHEPWYALVLGLLKNLVGAVLATAGLLMLFAPGQGLLTLLAGLLLMNFPGKFRLERWLVARPGVFRALNWLRSRHGVEAFEPPAVRHGN